MTIRTRRHGGDGSASPWPSAARSSELGASSATSTAAGAQRREPPEGLSMLLPAVGRQQGRARIAWWSIVAILCLGIFLHLVPIYIVLITSLKCVLRSAPLSADLVSPGTDAGGLAAGGRSQLSRQPGRAAPARPADVRLLPQLDVHRHSSRSRSASRSPPSPPTPIASCSEARSRAGRSSSSSAR